MSGLGWITCPANALASQHRWTRRSVKDSLVLQDKTYANQSTPWTGNSSPLLYPAALYSPAANDDGPAFSLSVGARGLSATPGC